MEIILSNEDLKFAEDIAIQRNANQRAAGRPDGLVKGSSIGRDIQGAQAELAVAKMLNLHYDGDAMPIEIWDEWKKEGTDVSGLEIRSTEWSNGRLLITDRDKDHAPYLLVTSNGNKFRLVGWCYGKEGKQTKYWNDRFIRPCYAVPQSELNSIESLIEILTPSKGLDCFLKN